jgi:hypothetical protein
MGSSSSKYDMAEIEQKVKGIIDSNAVGESFPFPSSRRRCASISFASLDRRISKHPPVAEQSLNHKLAHFFIFFFANR